MNAFSRLVLQALAVTLLLGIALPASAQTRLLRFPDLHEDRLVFTYAGDLWIAPAVGGTARRLTTHPGEELFAKFSPDGQWVAFTGQVDGDEQVYVVPSAGGAPRQLTYYPANGPLPPRWGYDNQVYGWHPDGSAVLFRSMRDGWDLGDTQLFLVGVDGGLPTPLPMPESGGGSLSPDGARVAYSPVTRDFRHWKRYEGGWAQDLYIFDAESFETQRITDHPRSDRDPMWWQDTIYFASDRSGTLDLYAYDVDSRSTRRLTGEDRAASDVFDVRWPSLDETSGHIVYELNGQLQILDPSSGDVRSVDVTVPTDALERRSRRVDLSRSISSMDLSPKAERAVVTARGELFSVPVEHGPIRNLTRSSGAHDREPAWSPDGRQIAFVSDADGEEEIWIVDALGRDEARQLTDGSEGRYYGLSWSPDGDFLAYRDQRQRLFVLTLETGDVTLVADHRGTFGLDYEWAPGGGWLTLSLVDDNSFSSIFLWRQSDATLHRVTDEMWNEFSPTFDPAGRYLYFVADRMFQPQLGSFEFNYVVDRESYVYAVALREDVAHPFPPRSDEVTVATEEAEEGAAEKDESKEGESEKAGAGDEGGNSDKALEIDLDGLTERIVRFPMTADNYGGVLGLDGAVLVVRSGPGYYGRGSDIAPTFHLYDLDERELKDFAGAGQAAFSADRKKVAIRSGRSIRLFDVKPGAQGKTIPTGDLAATIDPVAEWRQIYDEVWRRFRDFFYAPNMHGYDWAALQERFEPLLEHVGHRSDLNYLLAELIAELNVSHAYVAGGDFEIPDRPQAALLGARFSWDDGLYRIDRILPGHNEEPNYRSPLTEVGVNVDEGDFVFAINGEPLSPEHTPFRALRHGGGGPVELLVGSSRDEDEARTVLVEPVRNEDSLLYLDWVLRNRERVLEASSGKLGYLHIPDMGAAGLREWIKWFYGQQHKEGMVIDVRNNGGGNVSSMIIERLRREMLMVDFERNNELDDPYPGDTFIGHLVCLIDEDTASDGDQFAHVFREAGLGPLIGKRTWGGVVGIYGRGGLIDGGSVSVPEAGSANPEGEWVIEGYGVDPDMVVENRPGDLIRGTDAQLEKAIEVLLEKVEREPRRFPERPADPVKTQ
ncbi:MAG: S41 family peptidase [Acidobacteriota bacterium]